MSGAPATRLLRSLPAPLQGTDDPGVLSAFATDESGRRGQTPLAVVHARNVAQIQAAIAWAGTSAAKLVPVSSPGGPRRHGNTVSDHGCVILDLGGMDRVIHVDARDAVAIIEPGVTFPALNRALAPHGLRTYQPLAPRASKSVLTAFLEREPMTVPGRHWDVADPLASMELVFGTGDVFRTGGAGLPGSLEENLAAGNRNLIAVGPSFTDFGRLMGGAQGSLGVVAWASILCQRVPKIEVPLFVTADQPESLIEICYRMLRRRPAGQMFILNNAQLALLLADYAADYAALKAALPAWILFVELSATQYFPDEAIAYQRADLERDAAALGGIVAEHAGGRPAASLPARQRSFPDIAGHHRAGLACQEVFGLSQLDAVPAQSAAIAARLRGRAELAIYLQPAAQGVNVHCGYTLLASGATDRAGLSRLAIEAAETLADQRGFLSRPCHPWAHVPFVRDPGIRKILAKTKAMFDPDHIFQPGAMSLGGAA